MRLKNKVSIVTGAAQGIGLATALWAGLGWMANLREALSQMWGQQRRARPNFVIAKLSDLAALLSAFVAILATVALTALGSTSLLDNLLHWLRVPDSILTTIALRAVSVLMSLTVSWLLFTWMIARLPSAKSVSALAGSKRKSPCCKCGSSAAIYGGLDTSRAKRSPRIGPCAPTAPT